MAFFLESIALHDMTAAQKCFGVGTTSDRPSPQEGDRYSYSKCTVVVRVLEFSTTLLGTCPDGWKVGLPSRRLCFPRAVPMWEQSVLENTGLQVLTWEQKTMF